MHWKILKYRQSSLLILWLLSLGATLLVLWVFTSDRLLGSRVGGDISFGLTFLFAGISLSLWWLILYQGWSCKGFLPGVAHGHAGVVSRIKQISRGYAAFTLGAFLLANLVIYIVSVWFLVSGIVRVIGTSG